MSKGCCENHRETSPRNGSVNDNTVPTGSVLLSDTRTEIFYFMLSLWDSGLQMYLHPFHAIVFVRAVLLQSIRERVYQ